MSRILGACAIAFTLLLLVLLVADPAFAQSVTDPGTVIQTIHTSLWSPPSPDPSGITYRPDTGELLTCDAEVEEIPPPNPGAYQGVNVWMHSGTGVIHSTSDTTAYTREPTGVTFDPAGGRLWFSDDVRSAIFEVGFGDDGVFGTADDEVHDLDNVDNGGCDDPEDVTYDNFDGHLYVASGGSQEICEIEPGANGVFDGPPPTGDDPVGTFGVASYGILDPEGIVYDPFWDTLVVADRGTRDLYELTPEGGLLRKIDVNFPSGTKPAGVTIAPGSTNPSLRNYWVVDRGMDNDGNPAENDGRIFEVVAVPLGGNGAPIVDAGPSQTIHWPANSADLDGFVGDDGHPYPPSTVASLWSDQSGPGSVTFGNPNEPRTTASFPAPGIYVLQLVASDTELESTDTVTIVVSDVTLSATAIGPGSVTLDPPGGSYTTGQNVTVTAQPDPDAGFTGWSGDLTGSANPETLVMDGNKSVTASFATLVRLDVITTGPGSVTLTPEGGRYLPGTQVTLTAVPAANAVFGGWGGALSGSANPEALTVDADVSVTASFAPTYALTLTVTGSGSVTVDPPTGPYPAGTQLTLTAEPGGPGYVFDGWSGDLAGSANPETLVMDAEKFVTARFRSTVGGGGGGCGIGPELAALMPALGWLHRRRRRA